MESAIALANFLASLPTYILIIFVIFGFLWIQNKQIAIQQAQRQDAKEATDRSLRAVEEANRTQQSVQKILQSTIDVEAERVKAVNLTAESVAANTLAVAALVQGTSVINTTGQDTNEIANAMIVLMRATGLKNEAMLKAMGLDIKVIAQQATAPTEAGEQAVKEIAERPPEDPPEILPAT